MFKYEDLKQIRQKNKNTQSDIAQTLNITREQYYLYETGKREMPMHHFITLAKYYNVSLDYLAGLTDTPRKLYNENTEQTDNQPYPDTKKE